ncbi:chemotaxis-specific protein-glutamate methyltransferase CheB [Allosphingosinicella deserti]|uniref:chemotaxis-specific protein-glutamate methyltransferase CheB n=1 Tax=Allosphingosinicella deserti TaxID=2116704 RepID=UPI001E55AE57|nr:chemotaxis-specific protein-glutamate methyltransferase CheB [Sphingomonas deserti]
MSSAAPAAPNPPIGDVDRSPPIRLMIVDDSPVARSVLARMLGVYRDFEVVHLAGTAHEALDALATIAIDIVLLDVEMPGRTGLDALPEILERGQGARVLVVSSACDEGAEAAVRALALGAADTLPKPGTGRFAGRFSEELAERLRRIGPAVRPGHPVASVRLRPASDGRLACLALGASTGGLHAVTGILKALPAMIGAPILVTQHLPPVFMPFFARQIESACGRTTRVAEEGLALQAEEVVLAPGHAHLALEQQGGRVVVRLDRTPMPSGCVPSVDVMFAAAGEMFGRGALGVVLSGMGRDGLEGARKLVERSGTIFAQDRATSAVWGMPRAVAEAGLASAVLPPSDLARRITNRIEGGTWK